jgi:hypothetical protein
MRPVKTFWLFFPAIAVLLLLSGKSFAQSGGAYLHAGAGARALGAGGAFVAQVNDVTAGYWNPAGLGEVAGPQVGGMYSVLSLNRQHNYVAAAYPFGPAGTVGISWIGYRTANIVVRNRLGSVKGKSGNGQNALLFSYGNQIAEKFAVGGNMKLLFQNFTGASRIGFDLGAKFKLSEVVAFGAGLQNLQPQISWKIAGKGRKALPVNARAGVHVKPLPFMNLAADYEFNDQQKGRWHAGWEVLWRERLGLRTGSDDGAFTLGASLTRIAIGSHVLEVDYGFARDAFDRSASHRLAFLLKLGNSEFGIAPSPRREKKMKPLSEETDYDKILAAREKAKNGLMIEKNASGELATAEPEPEATSERSTFEQILTGDESEETTAAPALEEENTSPPEGDLPVQNVVAEDERNKIAPEQSNETAEPDFAERIARLDAQTNAGEKAGAQPVPHENVETALAPMATETAELTFEEKMARLEAQTNAGESGNAEIASRENVETSPELTFEEKIAQLEAQTNAGKSSGAENTAKRNGAAVSIPSETAAAEPTLEERMALLEAQGNTGAEPAAYENMRTAPQNGMNVETPRMTYGNKNGLTIPAIAPGKRLGHSLAALFEAQVIEARPAYWIINLGERAGFNADMMVEIYQPTPDGDTGRAYGVAQPVDVRSLYSVIQITKRRSKHVPAAGEKVILKYLYPSVNY